VSVNISTGVFDLRFVRQNAYILRKRRPKWP